MLARAVQPPAGVERREQAGDLGVAQLPAGDGSRADVDAGEAITHGRAILAGLERSRVAGSSWLAGIVGDLLSRPRLRYPDDYVGLAVPNIVVTRGSLRGDEFTATEVRPVPARADDEQQRRCEERVDPHEYTARCATGMCR